MPVRLGGMTVVRLLGRLGLLVVVALALLSFVPSGAAEAASCVNPDGSPGVMLENGLCKGNARLVTTTCLSGGMAVAPLPTGVCPPGSAPVQEGYGLTHLMGTLYSVGTWLFAIGSIYLLLMCWRAGLALAAAGDDPKARATAMQSLISYAIGSFVFFGAAMIGTIIRSWQG